MMEETICLKGKELKSIDSYDFPALKKALEMEPEEVIAEVKKSGLKGRGGAGFPTGVKWDFAIKEDADKKYMICNADEGEPGTFKDRYLLEKRPLKVLEGIMIGAYAIGANEGFIYIRGEYDKAIKIFKKVVEEAEEENLLGKNILDSNFNFEFYVVRGAGAYVCGDETSLINSIEGKRGRSRIVPPYPIQEGLYGKPTVVNNVETLTATAEIVRIGGEEYAKMGTKESKGTKLVCLSGDVNEPGIYEIEFGQMSLREVIYKFGKGIKDNKALKFVIPGGIATAALDKNEIDIPYTYEDIAEAGSGLGSGAVIVVSEKHDLLDMMLTVSRFFMDETCGTCFPCREGNRQINKILKESDGTFSNQELELIKDIGKTIHYAARCGLGQTSLDFISSIIDKYQDELTARGDKVC